MSELYPYQRDGSQWLAESEGFKILHWDMGVGKTAAAIEGLNKVGGTALIICPAVGRRNWARELETWLDGDRTVQLIENYKDEPAADIVVVSYNMASRPIIHKALSDRVFDVTILDEIQYLKSIKSLRTKAILGYGAFRRRGLVEKANYVWGLSGTPAPNNLGEMYSWLRACAPELMTQPSGRPVSYENFIERYCKTIPTIYGPKIVGNKTDALPEFLEKIKPITSRLKKEAVLPDLPPMRITNVEVEGNALMDQILESESKHKDEILAALDGAQPSEHVARIRRLIELAKTPAAIELVESELGDGAYEKIIVFAHHRDVITELVDGLRDWGCSVVHGGITGTARQKAIDDFQEGSNQVFVGQILAAGTSITLHANGLCHNALATSLDWVPGNNAQAFARIHRIGQTSSVLVRVLHLAGSIDQQVTSTLARKTRMLNEIFGESE